MKKVYLAVVAISIIMLVGCNSKNTINTPTTNNLNQTINIASGEQESLSDCPKFNVILAQYYSKMINTIKDVEQLSNNRLIGDDSNKEKHCFMDYTTGDSNIDFVDHSVLHVKFNVDNKVIISIQYKDNFKDKNWCTVFGLANAQ